MRRDLHGRRDALDHRVEHLLHPLPRLRGDAQDALGALPDEPGDLGGSAGVGLRQVDLVDHRDDLEVVLQREVGVGERLRLDPCAASTSGAPSHAWSDRETSYVKSTWPGVSIRLS